MKNIEDMRARDYLKEFYPQSDYTPIKRNIEIKFVSDTREAINKLDVPEEHKKSAIELLDKYLLQYEKNYAEFEIERKKRVRMLNEAICNALAYMN
jgi:hypothetical protein